VEAGTDTPSPSWGGEVCLQVAVRWWILMTGVVVSVSVLSDGGVRKLNSGSGCEAVVLFLLQAVSFLSVCAEGVSRFCLMLMLCVCISSSVPSLSSLSM
jgi:hypothetical protein